MKKSCYLFNSCLHFFSSKDRKYKIERKQFISQLFVCRIIYTRKKSLFHLMLPFSLVWLSVLLLVFPSSIHLFIFIQPRIDTLFVVIFPLKYLNKYSSIFRSGYFLKSIAKFEVLSQVKNSTTFEWCNLIFSHYKSPALARNVCRLEIICGSSTLFVVFIQLFFFFLLS